MRILLLTDTPPSGETALGQLLGQLCLNLPAGSLACFVAREGAVQPILDPRLAAVPVQWAFKPGEFGLSSATGNKAVRVAGMLREYGRRALRIPPLVNAAIAFGREHKVDAVWAVLHGQTVVRMARSVARALNVPLFSHVPDSFEGWLTTRLVDPLNRRAAAKVFRTALAGSVSCAVASPAMADEYARTFAIECVPLLPAVEVDEARLSSASRKGSDELVIGMAGQTYLQEEWSNLIDALTQHEWMVGGRRVKILTYGSPPPPTPGPRGRVEHRHFAPQSEVINALAAEADVLYCPHPFNPMLAEFSRLGFPSKLATYFAAGKPVLFHGPAYSAAYGLLRETGAAVCATGADAQSVHAALRQLAVDPELCMQTANAGFALARERFSAARQYVDVNMFLSGRAETDLANFRPERQTRRPRPSGSTSGSGPKPLAPPASLRAPDSNPHQIGDSAERYVLTADLQRAEALNAALTSELLETRSREKALQLEVERLAKGDFGQQQAGEGMPAREPDMAEETIALHHLVAAKEEDIQNLRRELEASLALQYATSAALQRAESANDGVLNQLQVVQLEKDEAATKLASTQAELDALRVRVETLSTALTEAIHERTRLLHALELGEVRSAATVEQLKSEMGHIRQEADRAFSERGHGLAEIAAMRERLDVLQRELNESRTELAVQNVRLALTGELIELRGKVAVAGTLAQAENAMAKLTDAERTAALARDTLASVQQAHASEVRAGIEFITNQIAEAKEIKDAEGRIAGRLAMLTSDISAVRRTLAPPPGDSNAQSSYLRDLYLDLLEGSLTGTISADPNMDRWGEHKFDPDRRLLGRDWPQTAQTMIGVARMRNIRTLANQLLQEGIEGDFLEAGVWRGGACIYMRGILLANADQTRNVWVADSFKGLPPPDPTRYPADTADQHHEYDELQVTADQVRRNFEAFGLLDERVKFLEGWFKDTLPVAPIEKLALLRLDGDMYSSTMESLEALYHKVSPGGFIIIDDYILKPCREAVTDFRKRLGISDPIQEVDGAAVYWRKINHPALSAIRRAGGAHAVKGQ